MGMDLIIEQASGSGWNKKYCEYVFLRYCTAGGGGGVSM